MRKIIPLNDNWYFEPYFSPEILDGEYDFLKCENVNLPHSVFKSGISYFDEKEHRKVSVYYKEFSLEQNYHGSRIMLTFDGVLSYCEIYVNGIFISSHRSETNFEADITVAVKFDSVNKIIIKTDSTIREDVPSSGLNGPMISYGGIFRDVFLEVRKGEIIVDSFVYVTDVLEEKKTVSIDILLHDFFPDTHLTAQILDGEGNEIGIVPEKSVLRATTTIKGQIKDLRLWTVDNPVLYTAKILLVRGNKIIDIKRVKFGVRSVVFTRNGFYLNGRKLKLIGLNRMDSFPYLGRAATSLLQKEDARILKQKLGCNVVRVHSSVSADFIEECDKTGLLVITDISGDGYLGKNEWKDSIINVVSDTVKLYRNSPSIIAWGVRINNSPDFDELYFKTNKASKDLDPTRATIGARNFSSSRLYEDVFGFNDYNKRRSVTFLKKTGRLNVPYLLTEHTGKNYPVKSYDREQIRLEQAFRHLKVIDKVLGSPHISGAIGMSFADFNSASFKGSGDNINHYGVVDINRNFKLAAYAYSSQFLKEPVLELSSSLAPDEFCGRLYAFTNCDYVKLYKNEREIGAFYKDKKDFKNLPHPPILITDLCGNMSGAEGFKPYQAKLFAYLMPKVNRLSVFALKLFDRLLLKILMKSLNYSLKDMNKLFIKHSLNADEKSCYKVEGYSGDKCVITKIFGNFSGKNMTVKVPLKKIVCTKSYEIIRIALEMTDNDGNILNDCFDPVNMIAGGSLEIAGEAEFSFMAGRAAVYLKTVNSGAGSVIIKSKDKEETIEFEVEYESMD